MPSFARREEILRLAQEPELTWRASEDVQPMLRNPIGRDLILLGLIPRRLRRSLFVVEQDTSLLAAG